MKRWFLPAALLFVVTAVSVSAYDLPTGQGIGTAQTVMISRSSASELLALPTCGLKPRSYRVELGLVRRFELSDLDEYALSAALRYHQVVIGFGFGQVGQRDYYAEQVGRLMVSYLWDSLSVGANVSGKWVYFGGAYDHLSATSLGLGAVYRHGIWQVGLAADDLTSPTLEEGSPSDEPRVSLYGEFSGKRSYSLLGRATWRSGEAVSFGIGQKVRFSEGGAFFWGLSTEPVTFGGGIEVEVGIGRLSYATNYHGTLGFSHSVMLAVGSRPASVVEGDGLD